MLAERCYICGRYRPDVRYSHHWRQLTCLPCQSATVVEPVGYVCESRRADGRLCLEAAARRRRCRSHTSGASRLASALQRLNQAA